MAPINRRETYRRFIESVNYDLFALQRWIPLDPEQPMTQPQNQPSDRKQFSTGAVRSNDAEGTRYDLISPIGLRRLAETYHEGAIKYSDNNWLKGFPLSDVLNHAYRHIELWKSGDTSEDHLAHAAWNLFTLMHLETTRPDLMDVAYRLGVGQRQPVEQPDDAHRQELDRLHGRIDRLTDAQSPCSINIG